MPCIAVVVSPQTLASLQRRDGARRAFTSQADLARAKSEARGGGGGVVSSPCLQQGKPGLQARSRDDILVQNLFVIGCPCFYGVEVSNFRLSRAEGESRTGQNKYLHLQGLRMDACRHP